VPVIPSITAFSSLCSIFCVHVVYSIVLSISCVQLYTYARFTQDIVEASTGIEPVYTDLQKLYILLNYCKRTVKFTQSATMYIFVYNYFCKNSACLPSPFASLSASLQSVVASVSDVSDAASTSFVQRPVPCVRCQGTQQGR
jgi:hypothetical protein